MSRTGEGGRGAEQARERRDGTGPPSEGSKRAYDRTRSDEALRDAFLAGELPVAVYGLGRRGLAVAAVFADVCGNATGVDVDETVVESVAAGECPVEREPDLPVLVADVVHRGALRATSDARGVADDAAVHVLPVPTRLDGAEPDLTLLETAIRNVAAGLSPGDVVFVESVVPPQTTENAVLPALAELSGLDPGTFGVAACPNRTASRGGVADVRGAFPKVVGGVDAESTRVARVLYDELASTDVVATADAATAEAVPVFESVFRDVNAALANELATYSRALDVDVTEVIEVANTHPSADIHTPGPGVGGRSRPVHPYFVAGAFDVEAPVVRAARTVNDRMPAYTVALLEAMLGEHGVGDGPPTVLVLGLAERGNASDHRHAPGVKVACKLADAGARVLAVDPYVDGWTAPEDVHHASPSELPEDVVDGVDAVAVLAGHDAFEALDWTRIDAPVLDCGDVVPADADAPVYTIGDRWP